METGTEIRSRVISIGTAVPEYESDQSNILEFMHNAYQEPSASRKLNILFHNSGINTRYSVVPDFSNQGSRILFRENEEYPFLGERMNMFKQKALPLALKAVEKSFRNIHSTVRDLGITHLITATCTGLYAPGLDAELPEQLMLSPDAFHTSLNFLGCNAAFPALRLADSIVKSQPEAKVLVVCVELCTLHFQPKNSTDSLLSNTIFGDGAAAVILVSESFATQNSFNGLSQRNFFSTLLRKGKNLIEWNLSAVNFEMVLDARVPDFLGEEMESVMEKICSKYDISPGNIHHWAIHPGGKRILDEVRKKLHLSADEMKHSYHVLNRYGNMSSPSILFVLSEILQNGIERGEKVFSMGFGPGISIESALMSYEVT